MTQKANENEREKRKGRDAVRNDGRMEFSDTSPLPISVEENCSDQNLPSTMATRMLGPYFICASKATSYRGGENLLQHLRTGVDMNAMMIG